MWNAKSKLMLLGLTLLASLSSAACAAKPAAPVDPYCGMNPKDWCPSAEGDPCGKHTNAADCKADPKCEGMKYKGESVIACIWDERGFASNCPTVGCQSPKK